MCNRFSHYSWLVWTSNFDTCYVVFDVIAQICELGAIQYATWIYLNWLWSISAFALWVLGFSQALSLPLKFQSISALLKLAVGMRHMSCSVKILHFLRPLVRQDADTGCPSLFRPPTLLTDVLSLSELLDMSQRQLCDYLKLVQHLPSRCSYPRLRGYVESWSGSISPKLNFNQIHHQLGNMYELKC